TSPACSDFWRACGRFRPSDVFRASVTWRRSSDLSFDARETTFRIALATDGGVARGRFSKQRRRLFFVALRAPVYAAGFPHRGDPRAAVPHTGDALGLIEAAARRIELARFSERDRRRDAKTHGARLTHAALGDPPVALRDRVGGAL